MLHERCPQRGRGPGIFRDRLREHPAAIKLIAEHLTALGLRFRTTDEGVFLIAFSGDNTPYEAAIQARAAR